MIPHRSGNVVAHSAGSFRRRSGLAPLRMTHRLSSRGPLRMTETRRRSGLPGSLRAIGRGRVWEDQGALRLADDHVQRLVEDEIVHLRVQPVALGNI